MTFQLTCARRDFDYLKVDDTGCEFYVTVHEQENECIAHDSSVLLDVERAVLLRNRLNEFLERNGIR